MLRRFLQKRRGAKGPFVLLTERRMITNAAADRLVGPDDEPILRLGADRLRAGHLGDIVELALGRRITVAAQAEPPLDDGSTGGIVLRLTPIGGGDGTATGGTRRGRSGAVCGWDSLTETERSVAELVAQGLTNREAGERLFLSRHTVGFHLRSIFRKLGASSRVDLARLIVESRHGETLTDPRSSVDTTVRRIGS